MKSMERNIGPLVRCFTHFTNIIIRVGQLFSTHRSMGSLSCLSKKQEAIMLSSKEKLLQYENPWEGVDLVKARYDQERKWS